MSSQVAHKIALVTGGNKGIGFAIVEALSKHKNIHVLLGARSEDNAKKALTQLNASNVSFIQIDLTDENSISSAASKVQKDFGGLDILVNNAGMAFKGDAFDTNVAQTTLGTNYSGTVNVCKHFFPLIRENGRVVHLGSMAGVSALSKCSKELQEKFLNPNLTIDELSGLMKKFIQDVSDGQWKERGWPTTTYGVSKIGVNLLARLQARDNKTKGVLINSCCPGWVRTDMAGPKAPKSPEEGAVTPVYLALLSEGSPTGSMWSDKQERSFL